MFIGILVSIKDIVKAISWVSSLLVPGERDNNKLFN